jgi:hypothetical protein
MSLTEEPAPAADALQELATSANVAANPPAMAALPNPAARSASQALIDRFTSQTVRLQNLRQRLEAVLGVIDGRRVVSEGESGGGKPRPTSYFEGLTLIADCKDSVLDGIEKAVTDLEALF